MGNGYRDTVFASAFQELFNNVWVREGLLAYRLTTHASGYDTEFHGPRFLRAVSPHPNRGSATHHVSLTAILITGYSSVVIDYSKPSSRLLDSSCCTSDSVRGREGPLTTVLVKIPRSFSMYLQAPGQLRYPEIIDASTSVIRF